MLTQIKWIFLEKKHDIKEAESILSQLLHIGTLRESLKTNDWTRNIFEKKQSAFLSLGGEDD